jgi:hypothetical protein
MEAAIKGASQRVRECGLPYSRRPFDEQMAAGKNRHQGHAHHFILAANYRAQRIFQLHRALGSGMGVGRLRGHEKWIVLWVFRQPARASSACSSGYT